jgi:chaperone modulatory protein CbpM
MAEQALETWMHTRREISLVELSECSGVSESDLRELVEYGALSPSSADWTFPSDCLVRLRTAVRLRRDLELETTAFALVVSFLARIEGLEAQVRALNAQRGGQTPNPPIGV